MALSSIKMVSYYFPSELSARGQSILASLAMALGAFIGRLISGYELEWVGDIANLNELFLLAMILSTTALLASIPLEAILKKLRATQSV